MDRWPRWSSSAAYAPPSIPRYGDRTPSARRPRSSARRDRYCETANHAACSGDGRMGFDLGIHQRLRKRRLVSFIVTIPAVTDEIDEDIFFESGAVLHRELGNEVHRLRIIAIHVEDRHFEHHREIGGMRGRARVLRIRGESDLVIDHHVQSSTDFISLLF